MLNFRVVCRESGRAKTRCDKTVKATKDIVAAVNDSEPFVMFLFACLLKRFKSDKLFVFISKSQKIFKSCLNVCNILCKTIRFLIANGVKVM